MDIRVLQLQMNETVIMPMLEFIEGDDEAEYSETDVQRCKELLDAYLHALGAMTRPTDAAIMEQVKQLVLTLNELNEATDYALIETDARESLWEIIQTSAVEAGLQEASEDITEEWRDW